MKASLIGLICLGLVAGPAEAATITTFSIDGARGVYPSGINKNGQITGTYFVDSWAYGFVRNPGGDITTFHASNTSTTDAAAIDAAGNVAGHSKTCPHSHPCFYSAFVRAPDGTITHFRPTKGKNDDIHPCCIKSDGWIAGYGFAQSPNDLWYAFIRSPSGVIIRISSLPNCGFSAMATSMNLTETITGNCSKANQAPLSGFIRTPDGNVTVFGVDGASLAPTGINDGGVVVGYVSSEAPGSLGFIRQTDGTISTFDVAKSGRTFPMTLNSKGAIAGYWAAGSTTHGFVRSPNGKITTFDVARATSTWVTGMNNKGVIIGYYLDQTNNVLGFVRTP